MAVGCATMTWNCGMQWPSKATPAFLTTSSQPEEQPMLQTFATASQFEKQRHKELPIDLHFSSRPGVLSSQSTATTFSRGGFIVSESRTAWKQAHRPNLHTPSNMPNYTSPIFCDLSIICKFNANRVPCDVIAPAASTGSLLHASTTFSLKNHSSCSH